MTWYCMKYSYDKDQRKIRLFICMRHQISCPQRRTRWNQSGFFVGKNYNYVMKLCCMIWLGHLRAWWKPMAFAIYFNMLYGWKNMMVLYSHFMLFSEIDTTDTVWNHLWDGLCLVAGETVADPTFIINMSSTNQVQQKFFSCLLILG